MDSLTAAIKLRSLLKMHDHSVQQLQYLDEIIQSLDFKISSRSEEGYISGGYQLILRKGVVQGIRETFDMYRRVKWEQIQDCVNGIISDLQGEINSPPSNTNQDSFSEATGSESSFDSFSMEFCELHRGS
ncbi:hypothetical protein SNE40_019294 [Patella caerulea]|uniref:Uncharacterized protein n=1 Tax=Patella caerulea TaxID=87958 RepID=A0AAN8JAM4_PATCE